MINSLSGDLSGFSFPFVYLSTNGVEWQIEVSGSSFQKLKAAMDSPVRVLTILYHKEDIMHLYGFAEESERIAFRQLITVSGIGPKQALKILSGVRITDLQQMLEAEDVDGLTRLPGLGKKTAQKIILQLRGHLAPTSDGTQIAVGPHTDLVEALIQMGFDRGQSQKTVDRLASLDDQSIPTAGPEREQELFRRAIVALSSKSPGESG